MPALTSLLIGLAAMQAFERMDATGDGRISRTEFIDGRAAAFARADRNSDGMLNQGDFPRAAGSPRMSQELSRLIAGADLNKDGSITRLELGVAGTPLFDRADRNGDGYLSRAEARALNGRPIQSK